MLRGSFPAKIDEKSRLKIPSDFRAFIEQHHGRELFVTSFVGDCVRIYPMPVWVAIEQQLGSNSLLPDPATQHFFQSVNYFGQAAEIDNQGRVLIHQRLREKADMTGEVDVVGSYDHLQVWNHERFKSRIENAPLTEAELRELARQRAQ
jgi:MraZ protein